MLARNTEEAKKIPLKIVGGNQFGRYPKISAEETYNFIVSDSWLVPYAGFAAKLALSPGGKGRGAYTSTSANFTIAIVSSNVYRINADLVYQLIGTLNTSSGDVFIAENNNQQIAITDYNNIYVYSYGAIASFQRLSAAGGQLPSNLKFPGYITFQDGRLIVAATETSNWYMSGINDALDWTSNPAAMTGSLQTKTDTVQAPVRFPGRGNLLFIFGFTVGESWTDQGLALFPYVKSTTFNLDYGCLNAATIATNENYIVWIAQNEQSGPALMVSDGASIKRISTDGIDFKLSQLTAPDDCYGFFFRQDGHLIYQFAFPTDNLSYAYDFNTGLFFTVTDEQLNYHPAKKVVFFNGVYYFVSNKDGNFYEFDTSQTNYTYTVPGITPVISYEIPRIRICPPIRFDNEENFIGRNLKFTIEQGQPNPITNVLTPQLGSRLLTTESGIILTTESGNPLLINTIVGYSNIPIAQEVVDLSISRDGGLTFGNAWRQNMNPTGKGKSLFVYRQLGRMNDCSPMLRFTGFNRFLVTDGIMEIYK